VAAALAGRAGVLEPLQTADSVDGQIAELAESLRAWADLPVTCVGHSWGAWLALLTAARHPELIGKLVLVGCGPLEARYAAGMTQTRLDRLSPQARQEAEALLAAAPALDEAGLARLGALFARADAYDPLPDGEAFAGAAPLGSQAALFAAVWPQAAALRQSGELLRRARSLRSPIIAIHGDHDPHPVAGVCEPLAGLPGFRCHSLTRCGHTPWRERQAAQAFYEILVAALAESGTDA
jgi:pimeloyl-ACP methyl ester carboxylesterase